ncbi:PEP-CTERM sorting domain-containing protein [Rheinheimera sp. UJ51]|uniref:PEP-CTERM sorting domain-containing protein n=1 Tax=Rheinheimera sp. UJ51 TaxID=2892446 RepID=UPI001E3FEE29|nr:PEP-CTERM sorting domain-containing protein [Rheinheimera sp. UJ51]MCC5450878.1 PEP-CTERM sorting domain-containing protein [Rheinheimera sp. UJ51]
MKTFLASLLLLFALTTMPAKAALIYITPVQQHVAVGDTLSIDVWANLFAPNIVSGWDINLLFDSNILRADELIFELANFTFDPSEAFYDFNFEPFSIKSLMVSFLTDDELAAFQVGPLKLFSVNFTALTDGVTLLSFDVADPLLGFNVVGRVGESLQLTAGEACVSVGQGACRVAVPEPTTLWLFASMLVLLVTRRSALT